MINRDFFFRTIKQTTGSPPLHTKLKQSQVDGYETIIYAWEQDRKLTDHRWLAYMLATVYHETAATIQPIEEYGKGAGYEYGKIIPSTGKAYYGRGYVQLTWMDNYKKFERFLGYPLVSQPELACKPDVACDILFYGMINGSFTGRKLSDYISGTKCDFRNSRRIINGIDAAARIAAHAGKYLNALSEM